MEENKDTGQILNRYFAKAKEEPPVMDVSEVSNIIAASPAGPMGLKLLAQYKYWLAGGLSVSAGVAFFFATHINNPAEVKHAANEKVSVPVEVVEENKNAPVEINNTADVKHNPVTEKKHIATNTVNANEKNTSANDVKTTNTKKDTYYFPGDAKVSFEMDGKKVNMLVGEKVSQLEIDGTVIKEKDYDSYSAIIEKGKEMKLESDKNSGAASDAEAIRQQRNRQIMNALISQLKADHLIDESEHFEFRFTGFKLFVNGEEQSEEKYLQYKKIYEETSGNILTEKSNVRIRH